MSAPTFCSADRLAEILVDLQETLTATKRQRIRDIMKHPDQEELLEETYDELENGLELIIQKIQVCENRMETYLKKLGGH